MEQVSKRQWGHALRPQPVTWFSHITLRRNLTEAGKVWFQKVVAVTFQMKAVLLYFQRTPAEKLILSNHDKRSRLCVALTSSTANDNHNADNLFEQKTLHMIPLLHAVPDLGAFSGKARGGVSVREGQGVVLMCTPPPHSPGKVSHDGLPWFLSN